MSAFNKLFYNSAEQEFQLVAKSTIAGILMCASFVGFFLLMQLLGLAEMVWLRSFNGLFLATGIFLLVRNFASRNGESLEMLDGLRLGLRATAIAVLPFSFFMYLVLSFNPEFLHLIQNTADFGSFITPFSAAGMITVEGLVSGFMISYIMMMYFKKN